MLASMQHTGTTLEDSIQGKRFKHVLVEQKGSTTKGRMTNNKLEYIQVVKV